MPIRLDTYEPDIELLPGTAKSDIIAFLYDNPELGFRPKELVDHLELPTTTPSPPRSNDCPMTGSSGKPQTATTTPSNTAKTFSGTSPASTN